MKGRKNRCQNAALPIACTVVMVAIAPLLTFSATPFANAQTTPSPTSSTVIQSCVDRDGKLRIVPTVTACRRDQQPLSWNKAGSAGSPGVPGTPGTQGATGPQGPPGPVGATTPDPRFGQNTNLAAAGKGRDCSLGEIILSAGFVANGIPANGQVLPINQNQALFALLGTTYGGNGLTTFGVPDLRNVAPNALTYSICTQGIFPSRI